MTAPAVLTFWRNLFAVDNGSEWEAGSWEAVFGRLSQPRVFAGDHEHPGWSAARFEGNQRARENVRAVFALCLDFDHGETVEGMLERLSGYYGVLHTTRKHTAEAHRFRVVLPLSRQVSGFEYEALWIRFAAWVGNVDQAPKDPSRFWFLPGVKTGGEFRSERLKGEVLDVDSWLSKPDPTVRQPAPERRRTERTPVEDRARKYIAKMDPAISGQGGHAKTWQVACVLAKGFGLSEDETFDLLRFDYNPRCDPPWTEKQLRHKAKQAKNSRLKDGYLLEDERDWSPAHHRELPPAPPDDDYIPEPPDGFDEPEASEGRAPGDDTEEIAAEKTQAKRATERYPVSTLRAMMVEVFEDAKTPKAKRGLTTGILELDSMIGGYRSEHVTLCAAQTSWGKSSFGVMALDENQPKGAKVLVISNEDKRLLYGRRIACRRGGFNALRMRDGELTATEKAALCALASKTPDDFVFFDGVGTPVEDVGKAIIELCAEVGFELVICDYLQRFRARKQTQDRRNEVTYVGGVLSDSIKKAKAAGLMLSQLKRTDGREPTMDDVKESGDLENMAEHVLIGWRKTEKLGGEETVRRFINVPKNKDGPVATQPIELAFNEVTASFKASTDAPARKPSAQSNDWDDFGQDGRYPS